MCGKDAGYCFYNIIIYSTIPVLTLKCHIKPKNPLPFNICFFEDVEFAVIRIRILHVAQRKRI